MKFPIDIIIQFTAAAATRGPTWRADPRNRRRTVQPLLKTRARLPLAPEQRLGQRVSGTLTPEGGAEWTFGRKRGLRLCLRTAPCGGISKETRRHQSSSGSRNRPSAPAAPSSGHSSWPRPRHQDHPPSRPALASIGSPEAGGRINCPCEDTNGQAETVGSGEQRVHARRATCLWQRGPRPGSVRLRKPLSSSNASRATRCRAWFGHA